MSMKKRTHAQQPCSQCGRPTAWHRPSVPHQTKSPPIYVCFSCLPSYRETTLLEAHARRVVYA